jgi:hypothetical protein
VTADESPRRSPAQLAPVGAVSVALAVFSGFVLQGLAVAVSGGPESVEPWLLGLFTPVPAALATGVFALVTRGQPGRRTSALTVVFLGTLASTVVFPFLGLLGLVLALVVSGVVALVALRLLAPL